MDITEYIKQSWVYTGEQEYIKENYLMNYNPKLNKMHIWYRDNLETYKVFGGWVEEEQDLDCLMRLLRIE